MTDDKTKEIHIRIENAQSDFIVRVEHSPTDIANLLKEREVLREALKLIIAQGGIPIASEACRQIIKTANKVLAWKPEEK